MEILEVDLDKTEALTLYNKYKDHPLQPKGYNVFIHHPPYNPENRIVNMGGEFQKVIFGDGPPPENFWDTENYGQNWKWSTHDVWSWLVEENTAHLITFTTVNHHLQKLKSVKEYFQKLKEDSINIYEDPKFRKYSDSSMSYQERYDLEIANVRQKIQKLSAGYLKRDLNDLDQGIEACIPENSLSNEVMEKWRPTIIDFINSPLEELRFTPGNITPKRTI